MAALLPNKDKKTKQKNKNKWLLMKMTQAELVLASGTVKSS